MSIRPLRFSEKLYALVLVFHGSAQVVIYHTEGVGFFLGVGVGVWITLLCMSVLFSAFSRARTRSDCRRYPDA